MEFAINILDVAAAGPLMLGISEAFGLLALSTGLIALAGVLRWVFEKFDVEESGEFNSEFNPESNK